MMGFRVRVLVLVGLLVVMLASVSALGQATPRAVERGLRPGWAPAGFEGWAISDRMAHHGVAGVQIAVIENGQVAWTRGYGVADRERGGEVTTGTLFQIGHLSMPISAALAIVMDREGVIDLDASANEQMRGWRIRTGIGEGADEVTLRPLLSHTGGLTQVSFAGVSGTELVPRLIDELEGRPPASNPPVRQVRRPGNWSFSAGGYAALQRAISDTSGRAFERELRERVLDPLGMARTTHWMGPAGTSPAGSARGHVASDPNVPGSDWFDGDARVYAATAAVGLWSTAGEYAAFAGEVLRAMRGQSGRLMDAEAADGMRCLVSRNVVPLDRHRPSQDDWIVGWAEGFAVWRRPGREEDDESAVYLVHRGQTPGFSALVVLHPATGGGVVALANQMEAEGLLWEIAHSVARLAKWEGFERDDLHDAEVRLRDFEEAQEVRVVASFTGFDLRAIPCERGLDGTWSARFAVPPGTYQYLFWVDGELVPDIRNPMSETAPDGTIYSRLVVPQR